MNKYFLTENYSETGVEWVIERDAPNSGIVMGVCKSYTGACLFINWLNNVGQVNILTAE